MRKAPGVPLGAACVAADSNAMPVTLARYVESTRAVDASCDSPASGPGKKSFTRMRATRSPPTPARSDVTFAETPSVAAAKVPAGVRQIPSALQLAPGAHASAAEQST